VMPQKTRLLSIPGTPSSTQSLSPAPPLPLQPHIMAFSGVCADSAGRRLIGRRFDDPEVVKDRKQWPFAVVDNGEGAPLVEVDYLGERKKFTPQEISSMVLLKMKQISEAKYSQIASHSKTIFILTLIDSGRKLKRRL